MDINPWQVDNIQEFYILKCPECDFMHKEESDFQNHAVENTRLLREKKITFSLLFFFLLLALAAPFLLLHLSPSGISNFWKFVLLNGLVWRQSNTLVFVGRCNGSVSRTKGLLQHLYMSILLSELFLPQGFSTLTSRYASTGPICEHQSNMRVVCW